MPSSSPPRALGRLALRRVVVTGVRATPAVVEPWPSAEMPWSRTLWGEFMPERRRKQTGAHKGLERRRG